MRARFLVAAMVLAGLGLAVPGGAAQPPAGGSRLVLHDVHTDVVDMQYTDGRLRLQTRIGSPPYTYKQADEVIFQVKDAAQAPVPDDPQFAFIGAPGETVWIASQEPIEGLLYAGWDTQSLDPGLFTGDQVTLELKGVTGPGRLEIFQVGSFGEPIRLFSSTDSALRAQAIPVHTHAHANWTFTAPGRYELTFQARATLTAGGQIASDPITYTWVVGDTITPIATQTQLTVTVSGNQATMTATVEPQRAAGWIDFRTAAGSVGHADLTNGTASLIAGLPPGTHQIKAHFLPRYENDFAASASEPTTVVVEGPPTSTSPTPSKSPTPSPSPSPSSSTGTSQPPSPTATQTSPACVPTTTTVPILDAGHVDVATRNLNGRTDTAIKDGTVAGTTAWRDPADVVLHVKPQAAATIPAGPFDFLGAPGDTIWQIPQTERSGVVWLGWNTESVTSPVEWSLTRVSGPGRVAVYEYSSFGQPRIVFNSGDGLPDAYSIPAGTHAHGNWAFTKQGVYKLTFRQQSGSTSDTSTLTVVVGDVDPRPHARRTTGCGGLPRTGDSLMPVAYAGSALLAAGTLLVFLVRRRRAAA